MALMIASKIRSISNKICVTLYTENCKTLLKEFKEDPNKWRDMPYYQYR
jgi:hypothetical protein